MATPAQGAAGRKLRRDIGREDSWEKIAGGYLPMRPLCVKDW